MINGSRISHRDIRHQLLRGAAIGFLLVPIISSCLMVGSFFLGYRFVIAYGTSMEPNLHDGDMILVKYLDVADLRVGNIVTLEHPDAGWITHRVTDIQLLPNEDHIVVTRGDARLLTEQWMVRGNETVAVAVVRVSFAGYVIDYLDSASARASLSLAVALLVAVWVGRRRMAAHIRLKR